MADPTPPATDPVDPPAPDTPAPDQPAEAAPETHIIGMAFDKITRADEVLLNLVHLAGEGQITITDAVVVAKTDQGKVLVKQTVDPTPTQGALGGSLWGLLIGTLFGGPVGGLLGAGAAAAGGGLWAKLVDVGLDDHWAKQVAEWLDPGTSALLLLVAADVRPVVVQELGRFEGQVIYCTFPDAVRRELERALAGGSSGGDDPGGLAGAEAVSPV